MFRGLINDAKAAAASLVGKYLMRASVAVPFVVAFGFGVAAVTLMLIDRFGAINAYLMVAGGFTLIGLIAVLVSEVLGSLVNDSGVAIAATGVALLVPLMVWLAAGAGHGGTSAGESPSGAPHSGRVEGADRVTVVSRGSTVSGT